jgi:hypothetical protein
LPALPGKGASNDPRRCVDIARSGIHEMERLDAG